MNGIDYFLYDNQTRSSFGRDWGLKAATGELAAMPELRQQFVEYCNLSFDTRGGILRDFGDAIGGLPWRDGYLLCVTLESSDHLGRPACAIVGLWFANHKLLSEFLRTNDPATTARVAPGQEPLPEQLVPAGDGRPVIDGSPPRRSPSWPALKPGACTVSHPFEPRVSTVEVIDYLQERIRQGFKTLPRILGITSLREPERFFKAGFALVFSPAELPEVVWRREVLARSSALPTPTAKPTSRKPRRLATVLAASGASLVVSVGIGWLAWSHFAVEVNSTPASTLAAVRAMTPPPLPMSPPPPQPLPPPSENVSPEDEAFLDRLGVLIHKLQGLEPAELRTTRAYRVLHEVPLASEHESHRTELLEAIEHALPAQRSSLVDPTGENLPFYFEGAALETPVGDRARVVREKLNRLQLTTAPCDELEKAFKFEFRDSQSPITVWCQTLREIRELALAPPTG